MLIDINILGKRFYISSLFFIGLNPTVVLFKNLGYNRIYLEIKEGIIHGRFRNFVLGNRYSNQKKDRGCAVR